MLKGTLTQPTLTIRELGGQVGGRMGWVFANPEYTVGERVLLFLDQRPDSTLRVMHFYLGKSRSSPIRRTAIWSPSVRCRRR